MISRPLRLFAQLALFATLIVHATAAERSRPNLLFVFIDDMGWGDFSCFGNKDARTPNIDRLASEGIRYEQFYVGSPICSPSRVALSTGQYPQRWRITSFLNNRAENERRGVAQWLDPKAPMLARFLKQSGYSTGHFGKWHMGGQRDVNEAPLITAYGFDESLTNFEGLGPRLLPMCDAHDGKPPHSHALGSDKLGHGPIIWYDRDKVSAGFAGAAIEFMRRASADGRPFFVNLWPDDVHSPFFPPADKRGDGSKRALYHGVLETLDAQLAPVFDFIRNDPKLRENTLVLVCSDNGPEPGAGSAGPFRGGKTMLYEGGIRSPLIAWGPGFIPPAKAGSVNSSSVFSTLEIAPSFLAIAGVTPPSGTKFDGENVADTIVGKATASRQAPLFWRRPPDRPGDTAGRDLPDLAVRDGEWKLLCDYDGSNVQLYNLQQDRSEKNNVAAAHPDIVGRLKKAAVAWHESLPPDNGPDYSAAPSPDGSGRSASKKKGAGRNSKD